MDESTSNPAGVLRPFAPPGPGRPAAAETPPKAPETGPEVGSAPPAPEIPDDAFAAWTDRESRAAEAPIAGVDEPSAAEPATAGDDWIPDALVADAVTPPVDEPQDESDATGSDTDDRPGAVAESEDAAEDAVEKGAEDAAEDTTEDDDAEGASAEREDDQLSLWDADDDPNPVAATAGGSTVTLPRTPFLVGLGVVAVALVGLLVLWRSAGGDTVVEAGDPEIAVDEPDPAVEPDTEATAREAELEGELAEARAEAAALEAEVDLLEARPEPPLAAGQMRRVVVGADAKFVSAADDLVAVVGPFGGLSLIDPATDRVTVNASVGSNATRVMLTSTAVWITNYADSQVLRVDPLSGQVVATFPFLGPDGITKDGDSLVAASFDGNIVGRIDPGSGELLQQVDVGGSPTAVHSDTTHGLWAAVFDTGEIVEIDQSTFGIRQRIVVGAGPVGITADETHLYVTNNGEGTVAKVDPFTGTVVWTAPVGEEPTEVVVAEGSAWVTVTEEGSLVQLDLETGEVVSRTPLGGAVAGGGPTGLSYGAGALWVAMQGEQSVQKVEL